MLTWRRGSGDVYTDTCKPEVVVSALSEFQNRLWDELQSVRLRYVSKAIYLAGVLTWSWLATA